MVTANPDIPNVPKTADLDVRLSFGPARPLVLFPVRLETRFFQQPDGTTDLCVRVYPDKVHVDSHEPTLTDDELIWGKHFWEQLALAGANVEQQKAAWRQLADRYDPPRAAWVAHATRKLPCLRSTARRCGQQGKRIQRLIPSVSPAPVPEKIIARCLFRDILTWNNKPSGSL